MNGKEGSGGGTAVLPEAKATGGKEGNGQPPKPEDGGADAGKRKLGERIAAGWKRLTRSRNEGGQGKNSHQALETISQPDSGNTDTDPGNPKTPEADNNNKRTSEAWKKATRRSGRLRLSRQIDPAVDAWRREDPARASKVREKFNEATEDGNKQMSRQDRLAAWSTAITKTMEEEGFDVDVVKNQKKAREAAEKPRTKADIRANPAFQREVNQRLDILTAEKGRKIGVLEARRVKNQVVEATLAADRKMAAEKVQAKQDEEKARRDIHKNENFAATFATKFGELNPLGRTLSGEELAIYKAKAMKDTEDLLLQQQREADKQKADAEAKAKMEKENAARDSGIYNKNLAHLLLNSDITDPAVLQERAMQAAIAEMEAEASGTKTAASPDGPPPPKPDGGETSTEAGIDTTAEAGKKALEALGIPADGIAALLKGLPSGEDAGVTQLIWELQAANNVKGQTPDQLKTRVNDILTKYSRQSTEADAEDSTSERAGFLRALAQFLAELVNAMPGAVISASAEAARATASEGTA